MSGTDLVWLIIAVCLIPIGGALACIDSALTRISVAQVEELVRNGRRGAESLRIVVADRARYTNLLLLLRMVAEVTATVLVVIVARAAFGSGFLVVLGTVVVMVVVAYVLIGVGPRTTGRQHPYPVALASAGVVRMLNRMFGPLPKLLILVGNAVTPGRGLREGPFSSEVELRELVDMAEARSVIEHDERDMIQSVFELGDTIAREVMVPRTDVVWIEHGKTVPQALALALRSGFSRIPVIGENVDDILGIVNLKDLARRAQDPENARRTKVDDLMRPPTFVPESKPIDALLREMQAARAHLVVIIDEYGGTAGVVSMEDIVEEIVGEITDEYDIETTPIQRIDEDTVRLTARLPVEDLRDLFGIEVPSRDDVETVGGLLAQALGRVPIPGASAEVHGLELRAESTGGRRNHIDTVLVRRLPPAGEEPDETATEEGSENADGPEVASRMSRVGKDVAS